MLLPKRRRAPYRTPTVSLGRPRESRLYCGGSGSGRGRGTPVIRCESPALRPHPRISSARVSSSLAGWSSERVSTSRHAVAVSTRFRSDRLEPSSLRDSPSSKPSLESSGGRAGFSRSCEKPLYRFRERGWGEGLIRGWGEGKSTHPASVRPRNASLIGYGTSSTTHPRKLPPGRGDREDAPGPVSATAEPGFEPDLRGLSRPGPDPSPGRHRGGGWHVQPPPCATKRDFTVWIERST